MSGLNSVRLINEIFFPRGSEMGDALQQVFERNDANGEERWAVYVRAYTRSLIYRVLEDLKLLKDESGRNLDMGKIKDMVILDIACGSSPTSFELFGFLLQQIQDLIEKPGGDEFPLDTFRSHEPWLPRVFGEIGAQVTGLDAGLPYIDPVEKVLGKELLRLSALRAFEEHISLDNRAAIILGATDEALGVLKSLPSKPDPTWKFVQMDLDGNQVLPFTSNSFDLVHCNAFVGGTDSSQIEPRMLCLVHEDPDRYNQISKQVTREGLRLVKPGGTFILQRKILSN